MTSPNTASLKSEESPSEDVSSVERATLGKLAAALKLDASEVDLALGDVKRELASAG